MSHSTEAKQEKLEKVAGNCWERTPQESLQVRVDGGFVARI